MARKSAEPQNGGGGLRLLTSPLAHSLAPTVLFRKLWPDPNVPSVRHNEQLCQLPGSHKAVWAQLAPTCAILTLPALSPPPRPVWCPCAAAVPQPAAPYCSACPAGAVTEGCAEHSTRCLTFRAAPHPRCLPPPRSLVHGARPPRLPGVEDLRLPLR